MNVETANKYEIRHQALLEVIRIFGGIANCSRKLKVSRTEILHWCNQPKMMVPYEYVLLMHFYTRVSLERLSPFTERVNKIIGELTAKGSHSFIYEEGSRNIPSHYIDDKGSLARSNTIARLIGLSNGTTYYRARKVYLEGNSKLVDKLDRKEISITMAARQIQENR